MCVYITTAAVTVARWFNVWVVGSMIDPTAPYTHLFVAKYSPNENVGREWVRPLRSTPTRPCDAQAWACACVQP